MEVLQKCYICHITGGGAFGKQDIFVQVNMGFLYP